MSHQPSAAAPKPLRGVEHPAVIDLLVHDAKTDVVTIGMVEPRPWSGSEQQLFQLQEKLNAYLSFALDGEMDETYPQLRGKKLRILLECAEVPDAGAQRLLQAVADQLAFQDIELTVTVPEGTCGNGCGCS